MKMFKAQTSYISKKCKELNQTCLEFMRYIYYVNSCWIRWGMCYPGLLKKTRSAPSAVRNHTMLAATRHLWTRPALTPARQAGTQFT